MLHVYKKDGKNFMFAEIFERACAEVGKAPTALLKEVGIGKSAMSNWRSTQANNIVIATIFYI